MIQWPVPVNVTELRGFLGLTGYYRKFVKTFSGVEKLNKPLTVSTLKQAMSMTPVLTLPDFTKPFWIETDACATGIGVVLV